MKNLTHKKTAIVVFSLLSFVTFSQTTHTEINTVPIKRTLDWNTNSVFSDSIINIWSKRIVEYGKEGGKVNNLRILLARLHQRTNIQNINIFTTI